MKVGSNKSTARRAGTLAVMVSVGLMVGACSSTPAPAPMPSSISTVAGVTGNERPPYLLGVGDELEIKFYGNPELDQRVLVRPDGMISLPFVDEIAAAGRTPAELDKTLTDKYTGELANPVITVIVAAFAQQRVYVGGEVDDPGVLPLDEGTTLFAAIQEAGGLTVTARPAQVLLIRRYGTDQASIQEIDVKPIIKGESAAIDPILQPYDVVFVPRSPVANANLFVQQYIRDMLPITPGMGFVF